MKQLKKLAVIIGILYSMLFWGTFMVKADNGEYALVVQDCIWKCGYESLNEAYKESCRGLLYDIENDGQEELILQYRGNHSWMYEIWTIENENLVCLLETESFSTTGGAKVSITNYDGNKYIVFNVISAG